MAIAANGSQTFFTLTQTQYNQAFSVVTQAQIAWNEMFVQFITESVAMGAMQNPQTMILISTALQPVATYGNSGALWQAFNALSVVEVTPQMAPFLTQARIEYMKNELINIIATI